MGFVYQRRWLFRDEESKYYGNDYLIIFYLAQHVFMRATKQYLPMTWLERTMQPNKRETGSLMRA